MSAGYSKTPLAKKLGIAPGMRVVVLGAPDDYRALLEPLPTGVSLGEHPEREERFIHVFARDRAALERALPRAKPALAKDGTLWLSWPKKASGVATDLDEAVIRAAGLDAGLVDVKICAFDATWSGLKFVYRLKDR